MTRFATPDKGLRGTPPTQLAKIVHRNTTQTNEARGIRAPHTAQGLQCTHSPLETQSLPSCKYRKQLSLTKHLTTWSHTPASLVKDNMSKVMHVSTSFLVRHSSPQAIHKRGGMMALSHLPTLASAKRQWVSQLPSRCTSRFLFVSLAFRVYPYNFLTLLSQPFLLFHFLAHQAHDEA